MKIIFFTFSIKANNSKEYDGHIEEVIDENIKDKKILDMKMTSTVDTSTIGKQLYTQILIMYEELEQ